MAIAKGLIFASGAAAAAALGGLSRCKTARDFAVRITACALRVADATSEAAQNIMDDASDINAEARRQAKIDAAVSERLAKLEEQVRAEVVAEVDAEAEAPVDPAESNA